MDPERWIHEPSGTLEGGPLGCRWPLLILAFIRISAARLLNNETPPYEEDLAASFTEQDMQQIAEIEGKWRECFTSSCVALQATTLERTAQRREAEEALSGQESSAVEYRPVRRDAYLVKVS